MRPVASDDASNLVVDFGDVVEAFLDLLADHLELFRAEVDRAGTQWACDRARRSGTGKRSPPNCLENASASSGLAKQNTTKSRSSRR